MTRKQHNAKGKIAADDLRKLLAEDRDLLKIGFPVADLSNDLLAYLQRL